MNIIAEIKGLNLSFGFEENGINRNLTQIRNSFKELNSGLRLTKVAFDQTEKSAKSYKDEQAKLQVATGKLRGNLDDLEDQMQSLDLTTAKGQKLHSRLKAEYNKEAASVLILENRIDELGDEYRELAFNATLAGRAMKGMRGVTTAMDNVHAQIGTIAERFRNLGEIGTMVIRGLLMSNLSALVPVAGAATSAIAGIGGALVAVSGGAIGLAGAFGIAGIGIAGFAGMAKTALKMVEDGEMGASSALTNYKVSLSGLQNQWKSLVQANAGAIFTTMSNGIRMASVALTRLTPFLTKTANIISTMSGRMRNWITSSQQATTAFKIINNIGPPIMKNLLNAVMSFVNGTTALFNKLSPLFLWAAQGFANMAKGFNNWANSVQGSTAISNFVNYTKTNLPIVGQIFGNLFSGIVSLFQAFSGHSHNVLVGMQGVTQSFKDWATQLVHTEGFKNFISYLNTNGPKVWQVLKNIGSIVVSVIQGMAPFGAILISLISKITGFVAGLLRGSGALRAVAGGLTVLVGGIMLAIPVIGILRSVMNGYAAVMRIVAFAQKMWQGLLMAGRTIQLGYMMATNGMTLAQMRQAIATRIQRGAQVAWNLTTAAGRGIANGFRFAVAALTTSQGIQALKSKASAIAMGVWTTATKVASLATRGLGLAIRFMTGPIGLVIMAITALVAGIIYLWKTNSTFRNIVIATWNAIKNAAIAIFGAIKNFIVGAWNFIKYWSVRIWNGIKSAVLTIIRLYVAGIRLYIYAIRKVITTVFNFIKYWSVKIWNGIKNGIVRIVRILFTTARSIFNALKNGIVRIISTLRNWLITAWTFIKNKVVGFARALWNGVRGIFNSLSKGTRNIFNAVRNFLYGLWQKVRNKVVSIALSLWNGVKSKFNALSDGTRSIFNKVRNYLVDKWENIKNKVVGMATAIKDKVTGAFGKMRDSLKNIIDKIKGFFSDMMGGVEKGLNSLIKGINKVGSMLGMGKEMIKPVKLSTGTEGASSSVVSNGAISRPTLATVNDKGPGNARGPGGHQELIQKKNGTVFAPKGRDVTVALDKGDRVINGRNTAKLMKNGQVPPKFSKGTGKKKKNLWEQTKATASNTWDGAKHGISKGMQKTGEALTSAGKFSKDWITKNIGDVMDWIEKPGKLLNKILDGMGVGMKSFGIKKGNVPYDLMSGMFKKLKSAATDLIKSWFEEAEGGDGDAGWLLKHDIWQKFGNYTGGLGFNGGKHYGVDFGMTPGTNIKAVAGGRVSRVWNDYGGGKSIEVALGGGLTNWYMHLSKQLVKKGQKVKVGDHIAESGNTGAFTAGSGHLHFQLNKNGKPQSNVLEWLKGLGGGGGKGESYTRKTIKKAQNILGGKYKGNYVLSNMMKLAKRESNYDSKAVNDWDINAKRGTPSKGLFQMIEPTFKANAKKGYSNFSNPVHQAISAIRYIEKTYGWGGFPRAAARAYATGGIINSNGMYNLAEDGHGEVVVPLDPARASDAMKLMNYAATKIKGSKNKRPNQVSSKYSKGSGSYDNSEEVALMRAQLAATQRQVDLLTQLVASSQRIEEKPTGSNEKEISRQQGNRARQARFTKGI